MANADSARAKNVAGCPRPILYCLMFMAALLSGCSAMHQPYSRTIEHKMEVLSRMPRSELRSIDPRLISLTPPPEHLVDDGDILGVYIEGMPGAQGGEMPVRFADDREVRPAIGYPIPVRNGGFIRVPQVGVLHVRGMTVWQVEDRIRRALVGEDKDIKPGKERIHVSLMWRRSVSVMVVRQEELSPTQLVAPANGTDADRRSGQVVQLPIFENDVLHALLNSGGLPKGQAENAVYVYKRNDRQRAGIPQTAAVPPPVVPEVAYGSDPFGPNGIQLAAYSQSATTGLPTATPQAPMSNGNAQPGHSVLDPVPYNGSMMSQRYGRGMMQYPQYQQPLTQPLPHATQIQQAMPLVQQIPVQPPLNCDPNSRHPNAVRIPLSVADGEPLPFSINDVTLEDGDIIMVESRDNDYFFTAGLLGGGQYALPRQNDLDVIDAVLLADSYSRSTQLNSPTRAIGGVSVLNRDVTIGASRVIIERKTPDGRKIRFRVSLYHAMKNPDQRVIIEPGDRLYLEYTPVEAMLAFFERHLLDPFTSGAPTVLTN